MYIQLWAMQDDAWVVGMWRDYVAEAVAERGAWDSKAGGGHAAGFNQHLFSLNRDLDLDLASRCLTRLPRSRISAPL